MEEELLMLKSNGLLSCEERQEEMKQMEVYRSHTKFMKNKVCELSQPCAAEKSVKHRQPSLLWHLAFAHQNPSPSTRWSR